MSLYAWETEPSGPHKVPLDDSGGRSSSGPLEIGHGCPGFPSFLSMSVKYSLDQWFAKYLQSLDFQSSTAAYSLARVPRTLTFFKQMSNNLVKDF